MPINNALGPHNSATSINFKKRLSHPHNSARSTSATPKTVKNQKRLRKNALASIIHAYQTIKNMSNEQFKKVVKNLKNLGTITINNVPYLIAVKTRSSV